MTATAGVRVALWIFLYVVAALVFIAIGVIIWKFSKISNLTNSVKSLKVSFNEEDELPEKTGRLPGYVF